MAIDIEQIMNDGSFSDEEKALLNGDAPIEEPEEASPEPQPEPQPEPESEPDVDAPGDDGEEEEPQARQKPKWLRRVDAEKAKREAAEKQLAELRAKWAVAEQRFAEIQEAAKPKPAEPQIPDPEKDAFGHLATRLSISEQSLAEMIQQVQEQKRTSALQQAANAHLSDAAARRPDLPDAMNHLAQSRARELQTFGHTAAQAQQIIAAEAQEIFQAAERTGRNYGEVLCELAEMRGYQPRSAKPAAQPAPEADVQRIARGQRQASGMNNGTGATKGLTLAAVADMSNEEYIRHFGNKPISQVARGLAD